MAGIILRPTWRHQPQTRVRVDWQNPLTRGLTFLVSPAIMGGADAVSGIVPTRDGVTQTPSAHGLATVGTLVYTGTYAISYGSSTYTVLAITAPPNVAGATHPLYQGVDYPGDLVQFIVNGNYYNTANAGWMAHSEYENGGWNMRVATSAAGYTGLGMRQYAWVRSGSSGAMYLNAIATAYDSYSPTSTGATTVPTVYVGRNSDYPTALVAAWGARALSQTELRSLYSNPWQLFAPVQKRIFFDVGAATAYTLTAATGTFTETGNVANLLKGNVVLTTTGSFTETGNTANLVKTSVLATAVGAFTETGNTANLTKQWALVASVGSFVFTGNDATLSYSGNVHPPLTAATGSYTLTGNAAGLSHGYVLTTSVGTFTETGNSVILKKGNSVTTATGAFTLTGNDAALVKTYVLSVEKGTFILTGRNANLIWSGAPGVSVTFWTGVSKMNNSESSGGVSEKSHDITGGPSVYTVTETSAVSSDKKDSVSYVGYDHA